MTSPQKLNFPWSWVLAGIPSPSSAVLSACITRADEFENSANLAQILESVNFLSSDIYILFLSLSLIFWHFYFQAPGSPHSLSRSGSRSRRLSESEPGRVYLATPSSPSPRPRHAPAKASPHAGPALGFPGLAAQIAAAGNSALSLPGRINYLSDNEDNDPGPENNNR